MRENFCARSDAAGRFLAAAVDDLFREAAPFLRSHTLCIVMPARSCQGKIPGRCPPKCQSRRIHPLSAARNTFLPSGRMKHLYNKSHPTDGFFSVLVFMVKAGLQHFAAFYFSASVSRSPNAAAFSKISVPWRQSDRLKNPAPGPPGCWPPGRRKTGRAAAQSNTVPSASVNRRVRLDAPRLPGYDAAVKLEKSLPAAPRGSPNSPFENSRDRTPGSPPPLPAAGISHSGRWDFIFRHMADGILRGLLVARNIGCKPTACPRRG